MAVRVTSSDKTDIETGNTSANTFPLLLLILLILLSPLVFDFIEWLRGSWVGG